MFKLLVVWTKIRSVLKHTYKYVFEITTNSLTVPFDKGITTLTKKKKKKYDY